MSCLWHAIGRGEQSGEERLEREERVVGVTVPAVLSEGGRENCKPTPLRRAAWLICYAHTRAHVVDGLGMETVRESGCNLICGRS